MLSLYKYKYDPRTLILASIITHVQLRFEKENDKHDFINPMKDVMHPLYLKIIMNRHKIYFVKKYIIKTLTIEQKRFLIPECG